jgi:lipopolysaccharide export system protein LptA
MTSTLLFLIGFALPIPVQAASPVAGSVVSSDEWKVRRGADKEEEFIGDVRYRTGRTFLKSDWALFKHATQGWQAKGRVRVDRLLDDGATLTAEGDEAVFDQRKQAGALTGRDGVSFLRAPTDAEPDHGRADRSEWKGPNRAAAVGAVRIWGPRMEVQADRADYDLVPGELTLTGGRPVLLKLEGFDPSSSDWVGALQGDIVRSYENPRRLTADGKARGWIDFTQTKAGR